jgi:hypothetical protein
LRGWYVKLRVVMVDRGQGENSGAAILRGASWVGSGGEWAPGRKIGSFRNSTRRTSKHIRLSEPTLRRGMAPSFGSGNFSQLSFYLECDRAWLSASESASQISLHSGSWRAYTPAQSLTQRAHGRQNHDAHSNARSMARRLRNGTQA